MLHQVVEIVDIGAMMLPVVEVQREATHDRLESSHFVGQRFQLDAGSVIYFSAEILLYDVVDHASNVPKLIRLNLIINPIALQRFVNPNKM